MSLLLMTGIAKVLASAGPTNIVTTYCYLPDWAQAAVGLAEKRAELAHFEDVPFSGHAFSIEQLRSTLQDMLGRPVRLRPFPRCFMTLASPFWELARELSEMRYLWTINHTLSGTKLTRLLPDFHPTELRHVMLAGLPVKVYPHQPVRTGIKTFSAQ